MEELRLTPEAAGQLQQYIGYGASWLGPALVSGEGCRVTAINGDTYLDCTSQAWSLVLGHNHPEVIEAAITQIRTLAHARAGFPTISLFPRRRPGGARQRWLPSCSPA